MTIILLIILLCTLLFTSKFFYKSYMTPYSIFTGIFIVAFIILCGSDFLIKELTPLSKIIFTLSIVTFVLGSYINLIIKNLNKKHLNSKTRKYENLFFMDSIDENKLKKAIGVLFTLSIIGFLLNLIYLNTKFGLTNILSNPVILNTAIANGEVTNNFHNYLMILSIPNSMLILFFLMANKNKPNRYLKLMFVIEIIIHYTVKRNRLFYAIVLNILLYLYMSKKLTNFSWINKKRRKNYKNIVFIVITAIVCIYLFTNLQEALNKSEFTNGELFGINIPSSLITVIKYFAGNLVSMGLLLDIEYTQISLGTATFRFIYKFLEKLKLITFDDSYLSMAFVNIPTPYNTTSLQYYIYRDFGIIGMLIFFFTLGYISSEIYMRFKMRSNSKYIFYVTIISFVLLMSIREYVVIFLDFWIILITLILTDKYINKKNIEKI